MENISIHYYNVFKRSITDYHVTDNVDRVLQNPYTGDSPDHLLYKKSWVDTVQWHLEDLIRDPDISGDAALLLKRRIDRLNQERTDIVELVDDYFQRLYAHIVPQKDARHNTESLGWALDRLSILSLKEFHVEAELLRSDAPADHIRNCLRRKRVLADQRDDLLQSINWLAEDIRGGKCINKVYRQLKMYNESSFNPILYKKQLCQGEVQIR
jgi:hypothetical protein